LHTLPHARRLIAGRRGRDTTCNEQRRHGTQRADPATLAAPLRKRDDLFTIHHPARAGLHEKGRQLDMNGHTSSMIPARDFAGRVDHLQADVADQGNPLRARLRRALGILAIIVGMIVLADVLGL
jgi:hypothetical protein